MCIFSMYYICCIYMYILPKLLLWPAAGAREMLRRRRQRRAALAAGVQGVQVGPGGGPAWAAPRCCHTLANQHELASNEECTRTCRCRACWNGTEIACNPANWNGSGRNMHKYAKNMQLYVKKMHKICKYIDFIMQKICTKYARNMLKYASNMQIYAKYMQVYANNL